MLLVSMTIAGIARSIKQFLARIPKDALLLLAILLTATGSFGLGVLAGMDLKEGEGNGMWIEERPVSAALAPAFAAQNGVSEPVGEILPAGGQYVASKSGKAYYLPWCGGVSRIKEENKVWFETKEEAEAKGYAPAKNCKGI